MAITPTIGDRRPPNTRKESIAKLRLELRQLREKHTALEEENVLLKTENLHLTQAMLRLSEAGDRRDKRLQAQGERIKELEKIAHHDGLTGLLDRRGMEMELSKTLKTITRNKGKGVVVYLDLDKFKLVNDICDHETGDHVLASIGAILHKRLRPTDLIARIGGDEFLVFLQDVDLSVAKRIVGEIQVLVRGITVKHPSVSTLLKVANRDSVIDFSAGYCVVEKDCDSSFTMLMKEAEKDVPKFHARRHSETE
ncbi:MAG: hypothetical protein A2494_00175 [Candidatus Lloydbacteria bacterium RIFOXYC12_FULL_46_25]|uniref:GGDEF domain-containing protein n=1 Tax=Candidatus Lloydbacteria bacterium RIFOXYC12_FULL_46_25 TaxID=1798670 RepID=A0A1G2E3W5_9BACT|nr:MAG: hypothetical protein A2494_00175 [Candidatus Lloydbacteria bacterium RIFOXYC12_FULL_46_25]